MASLTIERAVLARTLAHLSRVIEKRNTLPILNNVRLDARGDVLALTGTDLDIEARTEAACETDGAGAITVPAATLSDIARKLPDGAAVRLAWEEGAGTVALTAGRSRFKLPALPVEDFPAFSATEMTHSFSIAGKTLAALFERVSFAISTEETRYYLNGVYLHVVDGADGPMLRAVATDGHRLARMQALAPRGSAGMPGVIVPRKTVGEIIRLAAEADSVDVSLSATKISVAAGMTVLTSKLIDGTFPDYGRVIPTANDKRAVLDRETFAAAVGRVAAVASERTRAMKLAFDNAVLTLAVANDDGGAASDVIDAEYDSGPFEIGFNARYLSDVLADMPADTIAVQLGEPGSPTLFQKTTGDDLLIVLMPMRV